MPRVGRPDRTHRAGSHQAQERDGGFRPPPRRSIDADALALREDGRSFAAIAQALGLKRATDARQAFIRGLRSRPEHERKLIVARELERLDVLEARVRTRDAQDPDKLKRRLVALAALREGLD
ncbi:MAG TPA: hypothetical protein VED59_00165 [Acidimicrobiales bacterium]|nr:hypothetical protein [Acidimicrobiales bacterium]